MKTYEIRKWSSLLDNSFNNWPWCSTSSVNVETTGSFLGIETERDLGNLSRLRSACLYLYGLSDRDLGEIDLDIGDLDL